MTEGLKAELRDWLMAPETIDYVVAFSPRCRDCADEDGLCPATGIGCGEKRKAASYVISAIAYGVEHGFLPVTRPVHSPMPGREALEEAIHRTIVRWSNGEQPKRIAAMIADAVEALSPRSDELVEALKAFVDGPPIAASAKDHDRACDWQQGLNGTPTIGQIRAGRAALASLRQSTPQ